MLHLNFLSKLISSFGVGVKASEGKIDVVLTSVCFRGNMVGYGPEVSTTNIF